MGTKAALSTNAHKTNFDILSKFHFCHSSLKLLKNVAQKSASNKGNYIIGRKVSKNGSWFVCLLVRKFAALEDMDRLFSCIKWLHEDV